MPAKKISPVEQHVEKAVLGLAGVLLLYCLIASLIGSAGTVQVGTEPVKPAQVFPRVKELAAELDRRVQQQGAVKLKEEQAENSPSNANGVTTQPETTFATTLPAIVGVGDEIDRIRGHDKLEKDMPSDTNRQRYDVPKVVQPTRVAAYTGRSTLQISGRDLPVAANVETGFAGAGNQADVSWVTVAAEVDIAQQKSLLEYLPERLKKLKEPYFLRVDLERAKVDEQGKLGSWETVHHAVVGTGESMPLKPDSLTVSGLADVEKILSQILQSDRSQIEALNPPFPPVIAGTKWEEPRVQGERSRTEEPTPGSERLPPRRLVPGGRVPAPGPGSGLGPLPSATPRLGAEEGSALRSRGVRGGISGELAKTDKEGLKIWAHDYTATPGETYEYHIRVVMYNPLAGLRGWMKEPDKSLQAGLASEWSLPTQPVTIQKGTYFFVSGPGQGDGSARIKVWKWHLGWFCEESFDVAPGQVIGDKKDTDYYLEQNDKLRQERGEVDFSTGVVLKDINSSSDGTVITATDSNGLEIKQDSRTITQDPGYRACLEILKAQKKRLRSMEVEKPGTTPTPTPTPSPSPPGGGIRY